MPMGARVKQEQRRDARIVGRVLRELRVKAGMTQAAVADRIQRPQQYVSEYERGDHRMDLFELRAVCEAVGTVLDEMIGEYQRRLDRDP
jgi:transcriptional regulator with XRE-family HTH domain